jgi:hypothetical protein
MLPPLVVFFFCFWFLFPPFFFCFSGARCRQIASEWDYLYQLLAPMLSQAKWDFCSLLCLSCPFLLDPAYRIHASDRAVMQRPTNGRSASIWSLLNPGKSSMYPGGSKSCSARSRAFSTSPIVNRSPESALAARHRLLPTSVTPS